jgi:hypothetical protein
MLNHEDKVKRLIQTSQMRKKNLRAIFKQFLQLDVQRNGHVLASEFFKWLGVKESPFYERCLEIVDIDFQTMSDQGITWPDFLMFVITYCLFSQEEIMKVIFCSV